MNCDWRRERIVIVGEKTLVRGESLRTVIGGEREIGERGN